jgi:hypothetical protein
MPPLILLFVALALLVSALDLTAYRQARHRTWERKRNQYYDRGKHYVQDLFPEKAPREQWHRANRQLLIARGHLQPEPAHDRAVTRGVWDQTRWYRRDHL